MNKAEIDVLLIDDDKNDVELALCAFRSERPETEIRVLKDGEEALEFLADLESCLAHGTNSLPKLILLDLKLPKVDGIQLLRQIKSNPVTQLIPVVILSASNRNEDLVGCYRMGANSFVQKPVSYSQFQNVVNQLSTYWLRINQLPIPSVQRLGKENSMDE
jgi:two-component system response regulator